MFVKHSVWRKGRHATLGQSHEDASTAGGRPPVNAFTRGKIEGYHRVIGRERERPEGHGHIGAETTQDTHRDATLTFVGLHRSPLSRS
jgi:hypothetical protein